MQDRRHHPEVAAFAARFFYGALGAAKTSEDVREAVQRILDSGYVFEALCVEMIHAPLALELIGHKMKVHTSISFPLGNLTLKKKLMDLEYLMEIGIRDTCLCLNYGEILDHRYDRIEREVSTILEVNQDTIPIAFVIQATLLSDPEIVDVCKAIKHGGGSVLKVNTGWGWGTSVEEVALIRRVFGDRFDVHPSGNIRTLAQVDAFLRLGINIIHSMSVFEIVDEFIARREKNGKSAP